MQTRAAVIREPKGQFTVETVDLTEPADDQILVRIVAAGMCHTDLSIRDQQLFQHDYAMHDAAMQAARAWTFDVFGQAQAAVDAGSMPDAVLSSRLRQATTWSTRAAADAVRFAYTWSGSDGLRNPSVLGRCFRDMHAGTQHLFVDNNTLTQTTLALLDAS